MTAVLDRALAASAQEGDATVITVSGDIDIRTLVTFAEIFQEAVESRPRALVLDLTGVDFFGSAGFELLIRAAKKGVLTRVVVTPDTIVRRAFELTRLDRVFPLFDDLAAALMPPPRRY